MPGTIKVEIILAILVIVGTAARLIPIAF